MNIRSIAAGAGTGKTTELTRIIRDSVRRRECRPDGIICTTFTKKAAGELIERVRQALFKTGSIDLAERLDGSLLGTVDSVCARLLGRFAFEAGISPSIEIISEQDAGVLLSQTIEGLCSLEDIQTIQRIGERLDQTDNRTLRWKKQVGAIAAKARENAIVPAQLSAMAEQSCNELLSHFTPRASAAASPDTELDDAITKAISKISAGRDATKTTERYLHFLEDCRRELRDGRLTWSRWVKLTKETPAKASSAAAQPVIRAAQRYEVHPQLHNDIERYTKLLFEISAQALERYQTRKEERGLLDFVDLEQRALALLQEPDVAKVISDEFDLLVVDEFQDTNPIQLALFMRLAGLVRHGAVWVGDIKQAIYGFRGSDPDLINAVVTILESQAPNTLSTTYRARAELVQVFNDLFVPAFEQELGLRRADVELRANRPSNSGLPVPMEFWDLSSGGLNKNGTPKQLTKGEAAQALAEGVFQVVADQYFIEDRDSGRLRPLKLRDIAVLCRTNDTVGAVAEALTGRGFPLTVGTSGLLSTPEARLAMACLRRVADPGDTLATAEIIALEGTLRPEEWLQDRLEYLVAHPLDPEGRNWGIERPRVNDAVAALHAAHPLLIQLTPAEALDAALGTGNVFATVSAWGPFEGRSAQRRANLEALRGLVQQYEKSCASRHSPATVAGFIFWCDEITTQALDMTAADDRTEAIHVMTYHSAKGLEWPVTICADLNFEHKTGLWDLAVLQDAAFDPQNPLANRRLRFWPWPFGGQQTGIPLKTRIESSGAGRFAYAAAAREELRLLYVGFTRARDVLVLVTRRGETNAWVNLLQAPWLKPDEGDGTIIDMPLGSARVPCRSRIIEPPASIIAPTAAANFRWFPPPLQPTPKLPALVVPSKQPRLCKAKVVQSIDLGSRLSISGAVDENDLGNALHAIFAADFINPKHSDRFTVIERLLQVRGLEHNIKVQDVAAMIDRFAAQIDKLFRPKSILVETPFLTVNSGAQRISGFIDLLLETSRGVVIIDHKSFLGKSADWPQKAVSYSGQLDAYRNSHHGFPIDSVWIHFLVGGGMVQIDW